jgi:predicted kinase
LALTRVRQRATAGQSDSEARADLYDMQAQEFKPIEADETAVKVDTTKELSIQLRKVCDWLRATRLRLP